MRQHTRPESEPYLLTKADIKALKTCDLLSAHYKEGEDISKLHCTKKEDDSNPWGAVHEIPVQTHIDCYEQSRVVTKAFELLWLYHWDRHECHVQTFIESLRVGDSITVKWVAGNNNDLMRERGLFGDQMYFIINRGDRKKTFYIASATCLDNSARMCQMRQRKEGE